MTTLDRFLATWQVLRQQAGWLEPTRATSATQAALLVLAGADHLAHEVPQALRELKASAGLLSNVRGAVGQALVALALVEGVSPGLMPAREKALRHRFRALDLPWMPGVWASATAAWLSLQPDPAIERALPRMAAIMERWNRDHPWLTGADDLHAAGLHALGTEDVELIGQRVEARYQALGRSGFGFGLNARQRSAQLTALRPDLGPEELVDRMAAIKAAFRGQGRATWFRSPEPMALLALAKGEPHALGTELHGTLAAVEQALGVISGPFRFLIAAGLVTGEHRPDGPQPLAGALLAMVVAAVQAEQAAAAAGAG